VDEAGNVFAAVKRFEAVSLGGFPAFLRECQYVARRGELGTKPCRELSRCLYLPVLWVAAANNHFDKDLAGPR
jgi:hypothetical protein